MNKDKKNERTERKRLRLEQNHQLQNMKQSPRAITLLADFKTTTSLLQLNKTGDKITLTNCMEEMASFQT
jgi:hypothetical protein